MDRIYNQVLLLKESLPDYSMSKNRPLPEHFLNYGVERFLALEAWCLLRQSKLRGLKKDFLYHPSLAASSL